MTNNRKSVQGVRKCKEISEAQASHELEVAETHETKTVLATMTRGTEQASLQKTGNQIQVNGLDESKKRFTSKETCRNLNKCINTNKLKSGSEGERGWVCVWRETAFCGTFALGHHVCLHTRFTCINKT